MKKYAIPGLMLVVGQEVVSILALIVALVMFFGDIIAASEKERRF